MSKSFCVIIGLFLLCGNLISGAEQLRNSPQVVVTDNRIESKDAVFDISVDGIDYKCTLSHKRWHQLQISPPFTLRENGLAASLTGALFINEKSYEKEYHLPPLFWEQLRGKTSISASEKYMTNIITDENQNTFVLYFQEILNLEVFISSTRKTYTFELPSHRSATVVMDVVNHVELVCREKNKNGILYLDIYKRNTFITEVRTGASVYQKYKMKIISDKDILLESSDVGISLIHEMEPEIWACLDAAEYILGDKKILVAFTGNATRAASGNIYDRITLICLDDEETSHLNLMGSFSRYGNFLEIISPNTFSIDDGEKKLKFQIQNGAFVEIKSNRVNREAGVQRGSSMSLCLFAEPNGLSLKKCRTFIPSSTTHFSFPGF